MAPKSRKRVHVTVELDVDIRVTQKEIREFVATGINELRSRLSQHYLLSSTPKVEILSYKEVG